MNPALQGYIAHNTVHSLADGFKLSGLIQNVSYDPEGKNQSFSTLSLESEMSLSKNSQGKKDLKLKDFSKNSPSPEELALEPKF